MVPALFVALLVFFSAGPAMAQGSARHTARLNLELGSEKSAVMQASSEVWCSEVFLGSGIARLSWTSANKAATADDLAGDLRVEITIYPGGFDNEKFASYEAKSAIRRAGESPAKALVDAPPLDKRSSYVVIRDLQPGVMYRWRLAGKSDTAAVASEALEFRGPICPVDSEMGSEPNAARSTREVQQ